MNYETAIALLKQADPVLGEIIDRVGECRLNQGQHQGDVFSALVRSILYQQLSGKAAAAIHRRFLLLYPDQSHPEPIDLLNTSDEQLRQAGISRTKIVYLKDLARQTLEGLPGLEELASMEDEAIIQTFTRVKGIGRWTVQMLLIFRLHRWDVLPTEDLGIRNAIQRAYQLAEVPTRKQIEELGQLWRPYRTIASWYLWRSLE